MGKWLAARQRPTRGDAAEPATQAPPGRFASVLLPVDGSPPSLRACQHLIALRQALREPSAMAIHLLNVQRPVSGDVSTFVATRSLQEYYQERSEAALAPTRELLTGAGVSWQEELRVGAPGQTIADVARSHSCDLIVMGARGVGSQAEVLLGSVAQSTIEHSNVPVLLVK
ncbi:MAG: universal stress protein [Burkholderiaceae bacterium]